MTTDLNERGAPALTSSTDINLWDPTWNYSGSDTVADIAKAAMRAYTQMARELGAKAPGDPKFLNRLEDRLLFKGVPPDVIDDVIFKVRLRGQQIDRREASKTTTMKEFRVLVRSMLSEQSQLLTLDDYASAQIGDEDDEQSFREYVVFKRRDHSPRTQEAWNKLADEWQRDVRDQRLGSR